MRGGPAPTPTAVNELRGNPGHRAHNVEEPKPENASSVAAPKWLEGEGRKAWDSLAPEIHRLGLLTRLDVLALAGACDWWARYMKARNALRRGGLTQHKGTGRVQRAEFAVARDAFAMAMQVFYRYGVTPAERVHLRAPTPQTPDGSQGNEPGQQRGSAFDELGRRRRERAERRAEGSSATTA